MAPVTFTAVVDDPDGDPVTVAWEVTRGGNPSGPRPSGTGTSFTWESPSTVGEDLITVTVSDDKGLQRTVTQTLKIGTVVTADVTGVFTWVLTRSPYIVRPAGATFAVGSQANLTIAQGVEVYIDKPGLDFQVGGSLVAAGARGAPVIIRPNSRTATPGDWKGISAVPSGPPPQVDLRFTEISHAKNALHTTSPSVATLDGCTITLCSAAAILHESTGALSVMNSSITSNQSSGIRVEMPNIATVPASITIQGNSITFNGDLTTPNGEAGISLILDDPGALLPITISNNAISRNFIPGVSLGNPSPVRSWTLYPVISNNNLSGNQFGKATPPRFNLVLQPNFVGNFALDVRNNWWGATDSTSIKATILDAWDPSFDPTKVQAWITPWLQAAP
ncbi:MAG: right-handed parallel beta-helix repeat-containing protein [Candidatus Krumholzibacteria bacterium]